MGVEVSHEDVVTTGIEVMVKNGREIWWTGEVRGDVDVNHVMDVDGNLVDDGCTAVVVKLSVQLFVVIVGGKQLVYNILCINFVENIFVIRIFI